MSDDQHIIWVPEGSGLDSLRLTREFSSKRPGVCIDAEVSTCALYRFPTAADADAFAALLTREQIPYDTKIPPTEELVRPNEVYVSQGFNNVASHVSFVGGLRLEDVIAADSAQLSQLGGSFAAIADRMDYLLSASDIILDAKGRERSAVFQKHGWSDDQYWSIPNGLRDRIQDEITEIYKREDGIPGTDIVLVQHLGTHGWQNCPFDGCIGNATSSTDTYIKNVKTGRKLCINPMTAHLARAHTLLEKENDYGISAAEFYSNFM